MFAIFSKKFICATKEYNTYDRHIPSPYFKKIFTLESKPSLATLTICACGFYELYVNGQKITKGILAPYISNPDHIIYYDKYDILPLVNVGENVLVVQLGNGMQNAQGGLIWDFDLASWRSAPKLAFALELKEKGQSRIIEADETVKTKSSPVFFDDLRSGCFYDANKETLDLHMPIYGNEWKNSILAEPPKGEARLCEAEPILAQREISPISIKKACLAEYHVPVNQVGEWARLEHANPPYPTEGREGWLYDFGENTAGFARLHINGRKGQKIELQFCEYINAEGKPSFDNFYFQPDGYCQRDIYICKGENGEIFEPQFTYHGFRYCVVQGISDEQATPELLTAVVCNSDVKKRADFSCSNQMANTLYQMVMRSDLSNFYYFPTDCPHREKNGWTGDAAVSIEHMLLNFGVEKSLIEWLRNIVKSQDEKGRLPGIVPTCKWGYDRLNGPAWDRIVTELSYQVYRFTGEKTVLEICAPALMPYLDYVDGRKDKNGLIGFGLGDWMQPEHPCDKPSAPVLLTDSILCMDFADKAAKIFAVLGKTCEEEKALQFRDNMRAAIRTHMIDFKTMTVCSDSQTAQAMGIFYGLFEENEISAARRVLLKQINRADNHFDCGILGLKTIFHVLADMGEADLAWDMIVREDFPSYGYFVKMGLTTLPEFIKRDYTTDPYSLNHHFFGDIANWFISCVVGIKVNKDWKAANRIDIEPNFISKLENAKAEYNGLSVEWIRNDAKIELTVKNSSNMKGSIRLPKGWCFSDNSSCRSLENGTFKLKKQ